jgi:hypothetical protein
MAKLFTDVKLNANRERYLIHSARSVNILFQRNALPRCHVDTFWTWGLKALDSMTSKGYVCFDVISVFCETHYFYRLSTAADECSVCCFPSKVRYSCTYRYIGSIRTAFERPAAYTLIKHCLTAGDLKLCMHYSLCAVWSQYYFSMTAFNSRGTHILSVRHAASSCCTLYHCLRNSWQHYIYITKLCIESHNVVIFYL